MEVAKNLGQAAPLPGSLTDIYTVPAGTNTVISSIVVANRTSAPMLFRLSHAINGAADTVSQYMYYDRIVGPNDTYAITLGIGMSSGDVIRGQVSTAGSINIWGMETS